MTPSPNTESPRVRPSISRRHFGWLTDDVTALAKRDPERLYLWLAANRSALHFAGLALALAPSATARAAIAPDLFVRRRKELFKAVYPDKPAALVALAQKLSGRLWRPNTYRQLATLMEEPAAAKILLRARSIDRRQVLALAVTPEPLRTPAVFKRLRRRSDAAKIAFALDLVERMRPDLSRDDLLRSLAQTPAKKSLQAWAHEQYRLASFPAAPWPGSARLKPLASWSALEKEAAAFRNCIRDYAGDIIAGSHCLYRYEDDKGLKAIVGLKRLSGETWIVEEISGPRNASLTPAEHARVTSELADWALVAPQQDAIWTWTNPNY